MTPLDRARHSLEGLSAGDSFGERFFVDPNVVGILIRNRAVPRGDAVDARTGQPVWRFTDDTAMALSICSCLSRFETIDQDWLVEDFAARYDMSRGYGPAMHGYLARIRAGKRWQKEAPALFGGSGSFGNGAAMRVAPLGAYFAHDLDAVVENARKSAEVTHAHSEAIAGAVGVAVAAAVAWNLRGAEPVPLGCEFIDLVRPHVPDSEVREKLRHARNLAPDCSVRHAVAVLGNGAQISAQDTVPYALWCAARHLDNYEEALWLTVSGFGDIDTNCAIVGGIVAAHGGVGGIPAEWLEYREPLPVWEK